MNGIDCRLSLPVIALCLFCVLSCTKRVYIPVESVMTNTDTLMMIRWRVDSVIDRDTIRIETDGDMTLKEIVKWRYRTRVKNDTLYRLRTDSIIVKEPYPVEKIKEVNRLYTWQKILIFVGVVAILFYCYRLFKL